MESAQEQKTDDLPIFSVSLFLGFIEKYFELFFKISNNITSSLNNCSGDLALVEEELEKSEIFFSAIENYDLFDTLSLACLTGLYYKLSGTEIASIEKLLDNRLPHIIDLKAKVEATGIDEHMKDPFHEKIYNIEYATDGFAEYIRLFINLSKRLVFNNDAQVKDIQSKHFDFTLNSKCNSLQQLLQDNEDKEILFVINVRLAELDEYLSCDDVFLKELIDYYSILAVIFERKNQNDFLVQHSRDKCLFLIYKILKRINKSSKLTNDGVVINTFHNQQQTEFSANSIETIFSNENSPFYFFLTKVNEVYDYKLREEREYKKISSFEELHIACKLLKLKLEEYKSADCPFDNEITSDKDLLKKFKELVKSFDNNNTNNKFTIISFGYLVENITFVHKLSSLVDEFKELDKLENVFTKCLELLNEYSARNDFENNPQLIFPNIQQMRYFVVYIEKLLYRTKDIINETRKIVDVNDIENFEKSISNVIEKTSQLTRVFFKHLHFLKNKNYYPIYNDINSCVTKEIYEYTIFNPSVFLIDKNEICYFKVKANLFLDSSYILPSNYSFLKFDMEERVRNINNINSQILSSLEVFLTRNVEKALDSKVKENQFNAIQTLSVYAIIITYILGSITALPKFDGGLKVLPYFLILVGLMLGFFVLCIRFLFVNEKFRLPFKIPILKTNEMPRWIIYLSFIGVISLFVYYLVLPKFQNINIENTKIEYQQSLHKDSLKIDSLKVNYSNSK